MAHAHHVFEESDKFFVGHCTIFTDALAVGEYETLFSKQRGDDTP